ncbi:aminotransferase class I and II [Micromonospora olivasterospora]|uniref:Aminotransferase n=1 Tax=Micromonospora olivasterospora TaxID=1880 RepID=A0A562IFW6_MICOL|nr:aminotransferase class I and II [Micromonospora olivasterospora]
MPRRVFVVLDEVYRGYATDPATADGLRTLPAHPNLVVLRSFSKAYGLAGLRVGYAVGHPGPIAGLRAVTMPFLVPEVAQAAAIAALAAEPEYAARRREIAAERDRVLRALRESGVDAPPSEGNFVWLPWASAPPASRPPAAPRGCWCTRSPARAPGSPSGCPRATTCSSRSPPRPPRPGPEPSSCAADAPPSSVAARAAGRAAMPAPPPQARLVARSAGSSGASLRATTVNASTTRSRCSSVCVAITLTRS